MVYMCTGNQDQSILLLCLQNVSILPEPRISELLFESVPSQSLRSSMTNPHMLSSTILWPGHYELWPAIRKMDQLPLFHWNFI